MANVSMNEPKLIKTVLASKLFNAKVTIKHVILDCSHQRKREKKFVTTQAVENKTVSHFDKTILNSTLIVLGKSINTLFVTFLME